MKTDLRGKVALVTGAARGIGEAIAGRLAESGAAVWFTDVDAEGADHAAARCSGGLHGSGGPHQPGSHHLPLDVTSSAQIEQAFARVEAEHGRLDILVNNAGVNTIAHRVAIDEFPESEWNRILSVDLTGLYLVSRAGAGLMKRKGGGRIINVASIAGLVPLRLQCAFVAAKAGVVNLTRAMALELAPHGILVNGIAPGSTLTDGTRKLFYDADGKFHDKVQRMLDHVPLGRPATVDEIAVAALFLSDPENSYMNGHILVVDGGWTAGYTRDF